MSATDHVGHTTVASSEGHVYDSTPPTVGKVSVRVYDPSTLHDAMILDVHWHSFSDPESGITNFHVAISSSPRGQHHEYIKYNVDGQRLTVDNTSSLTDGHRYCAIVKV